MLVRPILIASLLAFGLVAALPAQAASAASIATTAAPAATTDQVALCVYGDAYNTGGSRCAGAVCVGWTMGHWVNCYPRFPPCWACPSPPPMRAV